MIDLADGLPSRSSRMHGPPSPFGLRRGSLHSLRERRLEPVGGIEPPHPAYKAGPLPLRINRPEAGGVTVLAHAGRTPAKKISRKFTNGRRPAQHPEGGSCTIAVQFSGRSRCQTARCRDGIDRHAKTRAQKCAGSNWALFCRLVLRTIRSLLPFGGGHGLRRLVAS